MSLRGQWIGTFAGTNTGALVGDFDEETSAYVGDLFAYDSNPGFPRTFANVRLPKGQNVFSLKAQLQHAERNTGNPITRENIAEKYPGVEIPTEADTEWNITADKILLKWKTNADTDGTGEMQKTPANAPSSIAALPEVTSWAEFKKFVLSLEAWHFAYRGHEDSTWRLRTSFHRAGRASLIRFMIQDMPILHRHLSGLMSNNFNLNNPLDYAAFLNLVQHHGYPTPILDWTQSPFVAAYFAYRDLTPEAAASNKKTRILILGAREWNANHERAPVLMPGYMHMTVLEPLATNNPRVVPQQSISTVTNVDDLETYIRSVEQREKRPYLQAIDLPANEHRTVMRELALMGITAGSLFPGLDGACRQLPV